MSLRFLIIDTYYQKFLASVYAGSSSPVMRGYEEQRQRLLDCCFGTSDFYSSNLRLLGHEAEEIVGNCESLQRAWAREHGIRLGTALSRTAKERQLLKILKAQIQQFKPDVLYLQSLSWPGPDFLREIKSDVKLVVGQIAYGLSPQLDLSPYDLILTSFPHFVDRFRQMGGNSEYFRIGFGTKVLNSLEDVQSCYPVAFVGTLSNAGGIHGSGTGLLEYVSSRSPIQFWGQGIEAVDEDSPIRRSFHGEAWGIDMYRVLAKAGIVLNRHAGWAENNANNMRLYEATGVGAMLLTDYKDNLGQLFKIGKEVVAYRSKYECAKLIKYYLEHEEERASIAAAGQRRTLEEHTYYHRMGELVQIVGRYLRTPERAAHRKFFIPEISIAKAKPPLRQRCLDNCKSIVKSTPFADRARFLYRKWQRRDPSTYKLISPASVCQSLRQGWQSPTIPEKQRQVSDRELMRMYEGNVPAVFTVAAQAVLVTGMENGTIVEVGCASGYYYEVLEYLLGHEVDYTGIDYSPSLIAKAKQEYPDVSFFVADAGKLPVSNRSYDMVISGCVLLHVTDYERVIEETARVARHWCVFHRTPVIQNDQTLFMNKLAYGIPVVELAFSESELLGIFAKYGLEVTHEFVIDKHSVSAIKKEVTMKTYVCRKQEEP